MKLQMLQHQELSVIDLFEEYFKEHYPLIDIQINGEISLYQNIRLLCKKYGKSFIEKCNEALEFAYDTKYGDWDNVNDLRKFYGEDWCVLIRKYFENISSAHTLIDIGCNDGRELKDILAANYSKPKITLVDISVSAIKKLRESIVHRYFEVINQSFLEISFNKKKFDYCISLRTLHSSGIDLDESLAKCYKITKPKGLMLFSVSNGYIDELSGEPVKGMYDYATGLIDERKPFEIAQRMADKLKTLKAYNIRIVEGDSEIFVVAYKNEK